MKASTKRPVPNLVSLEEAARFWDTHDSADYDLADDGPAQEDFEDRSGTS